MQETYPDQNEISKNLIEFKETKLNGIDLKLDFVDQNQI